MKTVEFMPCSVIRKTRKNPVFLDPSWISAKDTPWEEAFYKKV